MKITVATGPSTWTKFEIKEWAAADTEHYGKPLDWAEKKFVITAKNDRGETQGVLRMEINVGVALLQTLIVGESERGKGIGQQLVKKAEQVVAENGGHKLYLQ